MGKEIEKDAVVYEEGQITGMIGVTRRDEIEYIIHGQTQTLLYISKRQEDSTQIVEGILQPFDPLQQARLSIRDKQPIIHLLINSCICTKRILKQERQK